MSKKNALQQQLEALQNQLRALSSQLKEIKEILTLESKTSALEDDWHGLREDRRSTSFFYAGILLSLFAGILGNFFVSLWFQELTIPTIIGLAVSSMGLIVVCAVLMRRATENTRLPKDVKIVFQKNEEKERGC